MKDMVIAAYGMTVLGIGWLLGVAITIAAIATVIRALAWGVGLG